jgi:hypothetical protein
MNASMEVSFNLDIGDDNGNDHDDRDGDVKKSRIQYGMDLGRVVG